MRGQIDNCKSGILSFLMFNLALGGLRGEHTERQAAAGSSIGMHCDD